MGEMVWEQSLTGLWAAPARCLLAFLWLRAGGPCRGWKGAGLQGRGSKAQAPFVWVVGSGVMPPSPYVFSAHDSTLFFVFLFFITGPQFMR